MLKTYVNVMGLMLEDISVFFSAGEISTKGLVVPMTKDIYGPALARLKEEGLNFMSKSTLQE